MNGCMSVNDVGVYPAMGHGGRGRKIKFPLRESLTEKSVLLVR
jgi:hypothetical protein